MTREGEKPRGTVGWTKTRNTGIKAESGIFSPLGERAGRRE